MSDKPDVVAELDAWLSHLAAADPEAFATVRHSTVRRARDAIVMLRTLTSGVDETVALARAEALDDAMRSCVMLARSMRKVDSDASFGAGILAARAAISALKDKRDE